MSFKNIIDEASTIGDAFKLMADVDVDDEVIRAAEDTKRSGQRLGERLLEMGRVTSAQLDRAVALQKRMRTAKTIEELADILTEVREHEANVRRELFFLTTKQGATP